MFKTAQAITLAKTILKIPYKVLQGSKKNVFVSKNGGNFLIMQKKVI